MLPNSYQQVLVTERGTASSDFDVLLTFLVDRQPAAGGPAGPSGGPMR